MSSIVLSGDTSGSVTVSVPAVAGTNTVTIPATTGTVMVSSNMPAFSVYNSALQTVATSGAVKLTFDTKSYDTASCWNTSTNRFTPTVAGYYQFTGSVAFAAGVIGSEAFILIRKNGADTNYGFDGSGTIYVQQVTGLVYLNGSTDYVELFAAQYTGGNKNTNPQSSVTYFQGCLMRSA